MSYLTEIPTLGSLVSTFKVFLMTHCDSSFMPDQGYNYHWPPISLEIGTRLNVSFSCQYSITIVSCWHGGPRWLWILTFGISLYWKDFSKLTSRWGKHGSFFSRSLLLFPSLVFHWWGYLEHLLQVIQGQPSELFAMILGAEGRLVLFSAFQLASNFHFVFLMGKWCGVTLWPLPLTFIFPLSRLPFQKLR